ncbi:uncharacterized protein ASCRUDRAFT_71995 [Ascoidea rubescens DSM 1968]|uniref:Uncharacterized protein n=1 Tax=Ascoidea rubescens DSM 1968 TaxID=1344418 RepID=A0A1D2VCP5_9ASCO|nr:hypothetical protein ASCRUDRAFT_71995 [Ascoidea rubescens DSM 1968]ODV59280.1 hypothetical protein ASCRUDRAFT_71995 [Ascoidea rubescens DSM 1968]
MKKNKMEFWQQFDFAFGLKKKKNIVLFCVYVRFVYDFRFGRFFSRPKEREKEKKRRSEVVKQNTMNSSNGVSIDELIQEKELEERVFSEMAAVATRLETKVSTIERQLEDIGKGTEGKYLKKGCCGWGNLYLLTGDCFDSC